MELCRACLSTEDIIPIDETFVMNYNLLTNLNIMLLDGMPQYSCKNCDETVKSFVEYRDKCITSEAKLQEIVLEKLKTEQQIALELEVTSKADEVKVKSEPKIDFEVDDDIDMFDYLASPYEDDVFNIKKEVMESEPDKVPRNEVRVMLTKLPLQFFNAKPTKPKRKTNRSTTKASAKPKTNEIGDFPCGLCKLSFPNFDGVKAHVNSHENDIECGQCQHPKYTWQSLLGHRIMHVPSKQARCHICSKWYSSSVTMEAHYIKKHCEGEKPKLCCHVCLKQFDNPRKLRKHMKGTHSTEPFICDYCNKIVHSRAAIKSHLKIHINKKMFVCDLCGFSCKQGSGLQGHKIRRHTPSKVYCKNCKRPFYNQQHHDRHKCSALKEKICPICGVTLKGTQKLSRHLEIHKTVGSYKCTRCGAAYKSRTALKDHLNRHDGVKPHVCEFCNRAFYTPASLVKHRRVHTGEKPYVCKICSKGFMANHNLKVHMKVHGLNLIVKRNEVPDDVTKLFKFE